MKQSLGGHDGLLCLELKEAARPDICNRGYHQMVIDEFFPNLKSV